MTSYHKTQRFKATANLFHFIILWVRNSGKDQLVDSSALGDHLGSSIGFQLVSGLIRRVLKSFTHILGKLEGMSGELAQQALSPLHVVLGSLHIVQAFQRPRLGLELAEVQLIVHSSHGPISRRGEIDPVS